MNATERLKELRTIHGQWRKAPRSLWIPAVLVRAALAIYIGISLTTATAQFAQSPGQHAAIIPDNAELFATVNLRTFRRQLIAGLPS